VPLYPRWRRLQRTAVRFSPRSTPRALFRPGAIGNRCGRPCCTSNQGGGAIFKLTFPSPGAGWTGTILYSFTGGSDGAYPNTTLVIGEHGRLYGAASEAGTASACNGNWAETTVHSFFGGGDGATPVGLALGPHGELYGAPFGGGIAGCYHKFGCGLIFSLTYTVVGESTFLLDRQLTKAWDAFTEYASDFPRAGGPRHLLHVGTAYKITWRRSICMPAWALPHCWENEGRRGGVAP
jgi:hypothetical protein